MSSNVLQYGSTPKPVDLTEEYVAGGQRWMGDWLRTLAEMGDGCWEMTAQTIDHMRLDSQVASSVEYLVEATLSDGVEVLPGASDKSPEYAQAQLIAEAWERSLKHVGIRSFLNQMLTDAITDGVKMSEVTWALAEDRADEDYGRLTLGRLAVKARGAARFVVDRYWNVVGIWIGPGTAEKMTVLPPEKFIWLSLHVRDEDPRGQSLIRAAHSAWFLKSRVPAQYHRFLDQLILPFFIGFTAPGADKRNELQLQTDGTKKPIAASKAMLDALTQLKSMFAAVFPAEAKVEVHQNDSTGDAFGTAFDTLDRQIVKAILLQDLATREGAHQSRAASDTHMSVLDYRVKSLKNDLAEMLDCLARRFTLYNFGAKAAAQLAPCHTLGDSERRDWATDLLSIAAGWRAGILKLADIPKLFAILGIELADDWEERLAAGMSAPDVQQTTDPNADPGADPNADPNADPSSAPPPPPSGGRYGSARAMSFVRGGNR